MTFKNHYLIARRTAETENGEIVKKGRVCLCVGPATADGWLPVITHGSRDRVRVEDFRTVAEEAERERAKERLEAKKARHRRIVYGEART